MRYTRPALAIATTLLAFIGLASTAQADDNGKEKDCTITIGTVGDHSNIACGNITFGDNATTGQGHTTGGLGAVRQPLTAVYTISNNSTQDLTCTVICNASIPAANNGNPGTAQVTIVGGVPGGTLQKGDGTTVASLSTGIQSPELGGGLTVGCSPQPGWTCTVNDSAATITIMELGSVMRSAARSGSV
ncbi:hypothetical protein [Streptomyces sp. NPDC086023]|uniref:hypothetical protein n=1 Tax=Streptomyces sp. NPDC086023 TaxID=3365746 RepID=UPI0037CEC1E8